MQLCIDTQVYRASLVIVGVAVGCVLLAIYLGLLFSQRRSETNGSKIGRRAKNKRLSSRAFQSNDKCVHVNEQCSGMKAYTEVKLCRNCFDI